MNDTSVDVTDRYLGELRAELADLPPHEVADVLDDITPHLDDLVRDGADYDGLVAEVGAPAQYADELRAAADYPDERVDGVRRPRLLLLRLVIGTLIAAQAGMYSESMLYGASLYWIPVSGVLLLICARPLRRCDPSVAPIGSLPVMRSLSTFRPPKPIAGYLRSLLPGWFVVSGVLSAIGVIRLGDRMYWGSSFPEVFGVTLGLLAVVAGQRSLRDRRWLWLSVPVSAYAFGVGLHLLDTPLRFLLPGTMHA